MVLGTQWLSTLGVIKWDFKLLTMQFTYSFLVSPRSNNTKTGIFTATNQFRMLTDVQILGIYAKTLFGIRKTKLDFIKNKFERLNK